MAPKDERELILVTSNADDGSEGTLRWALKKTQDTEKSGLKFDIVFAQVPKEGGENKLKTGYWTIALERVLPNIYKNDVRVNFISPKNITLHPKAFQNPGDGAKPLGAHLEPYFLVNEAEKNNRKSGIDPFTGEQINHPYILMEKNSARNASSSMLVVGDGHLIHEYLNQGIVPGPAPMYHQELPFKLSNTRPKLSLKNVNFVSNHARGGDGTRQSGGGGAMGGAILLIDGDLTIENSVFQNLKVEGGTPTGFRPRSKTKFSNQGRRPKEANEGGGYGGVFSTPLYRFRDLIGTEYYEGPQLYAESFYQGSFDELSYPINYYVSSSGRYYVGDYKGFCQQKHGCHGEKGDPALQGPWGYGWGSGGAGGPAGYNSYFDLKNDYVPIQEIGLPGKGGKQGGWAQETDWKQKILAGGSGLGAAGQGGGDTSEQPNGGEEGFGLGGAIAIVGDHPELAEYADPVLKLHQVDFYDVSASSSDWINKKVDESLPENDAAPGYADDQIFTYDSDRENIFLNDVFYGSAITNEYKDLLEKGYNKFDPSEDLRSGIPYLSGTSFQSNSKVAKVRGDVIDTRLGLSDVVYIDVESLNSVIGVTADLSDPGHPINSLWNKMLDYDENKLRSDYYASQNASSGGIFSEENLIEGFGGLVELGLNAACTTMAEKTGVGLAPLPIGSGDTVWTTNSKGKIEKMNQRQTAGAQLCGFAASTTVGFLKSLYYGNEEKERSRVAFENSLNDHQKKKNRLNEMLADMSNVQIGVVDTELQRTPVIIENFEIGRDAVVFPYGEDMKKISVTESIRDGVTEVDLKYENNSSKDFSFATLRMADGFGSKENSAAAYIKDMISVVEIPAQAEGQPNSKFHMLTTRRREIILVEELSFKAQGPASYFVRIDRDGSESTIGPDDKVRIEMKGGSDVIHGSYGPEDIRSSSGNDYLIPLGGRDVLDGGDGEDIVSYVELFHPLNFQALGDKGNRINVSGRYQLYEIEIGDNGGSERGEQSRPEVGEVETTINNIEGIRAFGASKVDLRGMSSPGKIRLSDDEHFNLRYSVFAGSGSEILGSDHADMIEISYQKLYNQPTLDPEVQKEFVGPEGLAVTTTVDGGAGEDVLRLDFSLSPLPISIEQHDGEVMYVHALDLEQSSELIRIQGIEKINISLPADNNRGDNAWVCPVSCIVDAGDGVSVVTGSPKGDVLIGESGRDELFGEEGPDLLKGGSGGDTLYGGRGDDTIIAGGGRDVIHGGNGDDLIRIGSEGKRDQISLSEGHDVVRGFQYRSDVIVLGGAIKGAVNVSALGGDVLVEHASGSTLIKDVIFGNPQKVLDYFSVGRGGLKSYFE